MKTLWTSWHLEKLEQKCFFLKKNMVSAFIWDCEQKRVESLASFLWGFVNLPFCVSRRTSSVKMFFFCNVSKFVSSGTFWEKILFSLEPITLYLLLDLERNKFGRPAQKIWSRLVKVAFYWSSGTLLEHCFLENVYFCIFVGLRAKSLRKFGDLFWQGYQSFIHFVKRNFEGKIKFFWVKLNMSLNKGFGNLVGKFHSLGESFQLRCQKNLCLQNNFLRNFSCFLK